MTETITIKAQEGPQTRFLQSDVDIIIYGGAAGGGKMLPLTTPIPTPSGWTTIGEIFSGCTVFGNDGQQYKVTEVHAINNNPETYLLTFDDGTQQASCADHLWKTFNAKELAQLTRMTDEWRTKRQSKRPSRALGNKSIKFIKAITARNKLIKYFNPVPTGIIRTTREIFSTLKTKSGRANHAIPVTSALGLPARNLFVDPYLLGLWLGDGNTGSGQITSADPEILQDYEYRKVPAAKYGYRIIGLTHKLRLLGVLNNKHIPMAYLRSSKEQRVALLQGLMDTDGTVSDSGVSEFDNTNKKIIDGIYELIVSLGWKCRINEGRAKLNGKDCGSVWSIKWTPDKYVFRLGRKRNKQKLAIRRTTKFRYIIACEKIDSVPMRCITVSNPTGIFLCGKAMLPTHNSWGLLLDAAGYVHIPNFNAMIFRKTYSQITNPSGLWDESCEIYPYLNGKPITYKLQWQFPSGAVISMRHMDHESTKYDYQGTEIPYLGWDELTHFSEGQFWYLMSRNRSMSGVRSCVRATCNPDADSWVADFISWWIDEDGYANMKRIGVVRWMIRDRNSIIWFDSKKEAKNKFPNTEPRSVTFIPSSVYDNKKLLEKDPSYLANLQSLPEVERMRLLGDPKRGGNWHVKAGGTTFKREHFKIISEAPHDIKRMVRFWDLAATEAKKGKNPDWTAGVKLGFLDGGWYVLDVRRDRKSPKGTEDLVLHTAIEDGREIPVRMEEEGGSSGKNNTDHYARNVLVGFDFAGIRSTGDKSIRANPVASASENGNVYLIKAPWNKSFLDELESFSAECEHDDQVDGLSGGFNYLSLRFISPSLTGLSSGDPLGKQIERIDENIQNILKDIKTPEAKIKAYKLLKANGLI